MAWPEQYPPYTLQPTRLLTPPHPAHIHSPFSDQAFIHQAICYISTWYLTTRAYDLLNGATQRLNPD